MNKAEVIKALSDELNGDVEGEKLRETRAYNDALRFALALVSQLDEPVQVDEEKIIRLMAEYAYESRHGAWNTSSDQQRSIYMTEARAAFKAIRPYLRQQPQQGVNKADAAEALSKAILEVHDKWKREYRGVSHIEEAALAAAEKE